MAIQSMLYLSTLLLSTLSVTEALPSSGSFKTATQVSNYTIVPWVWKGQVLPGGPEVEVEVDTLSDLVPKIKSMYPDYIEPAAPTNSSSITRRAAQYPSFILCNRPEFKYAGTLHIGDEGIPYLRRQTGLCRLQTGKGTCGRVSCSYNSGIYFCNDAEHEQYINCSEIGDYASDILQNCIAAGQFQFNGQKFRTDYEYSVLVAGDNC